MKLLTLVYIIIFSIPLTGCFEAGTKTNLADDSISRSDGRVDTQLPGSGDTAPPRGGRDDNDTGEIPTPDLPGDEDDVPEDPGCGEPQWNIEELLERIALLENKKEDWDEIIAEGYENYKIVEPIFEKVFCLSRFGPRLTLVRKNPKREK